MQTAKVYVVVGREVEVLDQCPQWDWKALGQRVFVANINGGDSVEVLKREVQS